MTIATYLTDQREGKKHGYYEIYEDDKIKISYDTYYPNVHVVVYINGKRNLAAIFSGHGNIQEYHGGAWEKYVINVLYPKALLKETQAKEAWARKKERENKIKNAPLNDGSVFA